MRACSLGPGLVGLGFRDKVMLRLVLGIELVFGLATVLGLAHSTFCHTSSPQQPSSPQARRVGLRSRRTALFKFVID